MPPKYLLDTNIFIEPYRHFYKFEIFPGFWSWLLSNIGNDFILCEYVYNEIDGMNDPLQDWFNNNYLKNKIFKDQKEQEVVDNYIKVINFIMTSGYYTQRGYEKWTIDIKTADPWLIALALTYGFVVVSLEIGRKKPLDTKNPTSDGPKIPDVCKYLGVECIHLNDLFTRFNFKL